MEKEKQRSNGRKTDRVLRVEDEVAAFLRGGGERFHRRSSLVVVVVVVFSS